ncbi:MAG: hypothetical protein E7053_06865 [Lentisphaerae bacterium]|nr:hypothetical protein [Lentisphaerota bacterium]
MKKKVTDEGDFLLAGRFCPQCEEQLSPADIEMFSRCPYCNCRFEESAAKEEFILRKLLKNWMINNYQGFLK